MRVPPADCATAGRPAATTRSWRQTLSGGFHRPGWDEEADLPRPFLESLRAEAETGQRAVSAWLHNKIISIDRAAVQILILLEQHRRDPAIAPEAPPARSAPEDADPQPMTAIPPWLRQAREAAAVEGTESVC